MLDLSLSPAIGGGYLNDSPLHPETAVNPIIPRWSFDEVLVDRTTFGGARRWATGVEASGRGGCG